MGYHPNLFQPEGLRQDRLFPGRCACGCFAGTGAKLTVRPLAETTIEVMTSELPLIDEHSIEVPASAADTWRSLTRTLGSSGGRLFTAYATVIGVDPRRSEGTLDQVGSTRVGFRVSAACEPERLLLTGRHLFSEYSLEWKVTGPGDGSSRLTATTRARFPGIHGRVYNALVIDSGAHARITRRMLASIASRA